MSKSKFRLSAVSPIDGRYGEQTDVLSSYGSEFALIKRRLIVEVKYFEAIVPILPQLSPLRESLKFSNFLRRLIKNFTLAEAEKIKLIEKTTRHDVKAVEYYLKEKFEKAGFGKYKEFVHIGLTSQDIDSVSRTVLFRDAINDVFVPLLDGVLSDLMKLGEEWNSVVMLARTHGQAAIPTRIGKEINVFIQRIEGEKVILKKLRLSAKFGGAVGNMNALYAAFPTVDWHDFASKFVESFGLTRDFPTTQVEHYDSLASWLDSLKRICTIITDCSLDAWLYIAFEYFKQKVKAGEVGSSTMPQKVNPIDFENAEGNLEYATTILEFLARKLPRSRMQRDLSGSTVIRNLWVPIAHIVIALNSFKRGINKIFVNDLVVNQDLDSNWAVLAEPIQIILRREFYPEPYEALKVLTRTEKTKKLTKSDLHKFIRSLKVTKPVKEELLAITPFNYVGK
ncbi:MAG: adenylosuccinate lyase [Candidatus Absconditicoccaceae bacterium]